MGGMIDRTVKRVLFSLLTEGFLLFFIKPHKSFEARNVTDCSPAEKGSQDPGRGLYLLAFF